MHGYLVTVRKEGLRYNPMAQVFVRVGPNNEVMPELAKGAAMGYRGRRANQRSSSLRPGLDRRNGRDRVTSRSTS
jgi:hypothetical protein